MKTIEELTKLTSVQEVLCKVMKGVYQKMQEEGIALALNENGYLVAYNAQEIEDCEPADVFGDAPEGYEYAEQNNMHELFPVWVCEELYVKRK